MRIVACCAAAACVVLPLLNVPTAQARGEGDTHITGNGQELTFDCNNSTLFVNGSQNFINATGVCYAVAVQGSNNTIVAETVSNDITVYGFNQTVMFSNGDPFILDRGRELGMTNRIDRAPA